MKRLKELHPCAENWRPQCDSETSHRERQWRVQMCSLQLEHLETENSSAENQSSNISGPEPTRGQQDQNQLHCSNSSDG
ncbi:hypothetical protein ATANTOWER_029437 [Ataeniobius toweri]|uniref:Uncharacterized protein n=1 Tax=Ataeniobius toweri TaxID=208326 RepID=A0ABU7BSX5_9TELE|nr:hypothetical protein [Ataeniobius toweri]